MNKKELKLNNAQQSFVDLVIQSLDEERIPWNSDISGQSIPTNYASKKEYNGMNRISLFLAQQALGTEDNRWLTFNQIKKEDAKLEKGSKGFPVQFFMKYNARTKSEWSDKDFNAMSPEQKEIEIENLKILTKTATVFNGSMVQGLPEFVKPEPKFHSQNEMVNEYIDNLKEKMEFDFEEVGIQPRYIPSLDKVEMPSSTRFNSIEDYYSVFIHEVGHATGHENRMDRFEGTHDIIDYSLEELRVEFSAFFQTSELGISNKSMQENNLAYCQSWGRVFKENPAMIIEATNDALKIKDFMFDKGDAPTLMKKHLVEDVSLSELKEKKDIKRKVASPER